MTDDISPKLDLPIGTRIRGVSDNACFEGVVVEKRERREGKETYCRHKMRTDDGKEFWAYDFEIDPDGAGEITGYDSEMDTRAHIAAVASYLLDITDVLETRGTHHDRSKLQEPEKPIFDTYTPLLRDTPYGSDQYHQYLAEMKVALDHHYANNPHHPECHPGGVADMSLLDLCEMLADWKAACERVAGGDLARSLDINEKRFEIPPVLMGILRRTAVELGWIARQDDGEGQA